MESIHGAFFGLALAVGMSLLMKTRTDNAQVAMPRWTSIFAIVFVVCGLVFRSVTAAKQKIEQDSISEFGPRTFEPRGGMPAFHDAELY